MQQRTAGLAPEKPQVCEQGPALRYGLAADDSYLQFL